ncbi:recombination mediator RecR [Salinibius halmophilus]|uniref:recombination mediator RecR n=1 Tax=Salinibius halmophilus TaxID=1853216 RepID=UPI0013140A2D|nr:recombination mediator RecR [Salinibius halmophilus]
MSPILDDLARALRAMPGIGQKLADKLALSMVQEHREQANLLHHTLGEALARIQPCQRCRMVSDAELCHICSDPQREATTLLVVETPQDVQAFESAGVLYCRYFVMGGHLSMVDGIGPDELGIDQLLALISNEATREVIVATSPSAEGEATAAYIAKRLQDMPVNVSKLARGIPNGSDLAGIDSATLASALKARQNWRDHD